MYSKIKLHYNYNTFTQSKINKINKLFKAIKEFYTDMISASKEFNVLDLTCFWQNHLRSRYSFILMFLMRYHIV